MLALEAAHAGYRVTFMEGPSDVRALRARRRRREWVSAAAGRGSWKIEDNLFVRPRAGIVPGHRSESWERVSAYGLRTDLRRVPEIRSSVVVATTPWDWPAVAEAAGARSVFDAGDDWGALIPRRRSAFAARCVRIGREADVIVTVSDHLATSFRAPDRTHVIRNGVADALLLPPVRERPRNARRLVYAGTLSERFDAELMTDVLPLLPGWSLDLVGPCRYAGHGDRPAPELLALLAHPERVRLHPPVPHEDLVGALDAGTVLILPNRVEVALGQDAMKLYDYAARGRPIVSTAWAPDLERLAPPGTHLANDARGFADAVLAAAESPPGDDLVRRAWAEQQRWKDRFARWREVILI